MGLLTGVTLIIALSSDMKNESQTSSGIQTEMSSCLKTLGPVSSLSSDTVKFLRRKLCNKKAGSKLLVDPLEHPSTFWYAPVSESEKKPAPKRQNNSRNATLTQLKKLSVVAAGCCKNVRKHLPRIRKHLESFVSLFKEYKILLGESDSTDGTLAYLENWALNDINVVVQSYGNLSQVFLRRTVRLSYCRGSLLNYARIKLQFDQFQVYMALDVDAINDNDVLSQETFLSNFDYPLESWGAMSASQTHRYYDTWTIRSPTMNYDFQQEVYNEKRNGGDFDAAATRLMKVHWPPIPIDHDLVEMHSAFGGFTIYQTKYLQDCNYYGYDINNDAINYEVCDHVIFNLCVTKNGGRIFINPRFQNSKGLVN
ncbi:unnamed protein product [Adineta steineri]|uniref:Uncharacterized protein n=1 Tax=Adineta steineri TaxID=433720 RepID=A0A819JL79_9BILA|nr:unnamed protein product [Adineta steineri]CAF3932368.1 unnamed protein product [Adineta steineri]